MVVGAIGRGDGPAARSPCPMKSARGPMQPAWCLCQAIGQLCCRCEVPKSHCNRPGRRQAQPARAEQSAHQPGGVPRAIRIFMLRSSMLAAPSRAAAPFRAASRWGVHTVLQAALLPPIQQHHLTHRPQRRLTYMQARRPAPGRGTAAAPPPAATGGGAHFARPGAVRLWPAGGIGRQAHQDGRQQAVSG